MTTTLIDRFLEYACPDHHVRGRPAHAVARHAAMRLLRQNPWIATHSLHTAVVCGELETVQRILRKRPEAARERSGVTAPDRSAPGGAWDMFKDIGPKGWEPLMYLCCARLPLPAAHENALPIARALLDCGADPNAYFMGGDSHYTPLTGVIGEGEENRPPHSQRDALARLLLERGASPYDIQVVYNIHFHGRILWFMELMYEFAVKAGKRRDWDDPEWQMLDMGGYGSGARWHLWVAITNNDIALAEWCLTHGANPNAAAPRDAPLPPMSAYEFAVCEGHADIAELLVRHGATRVDVAPDDDREFVAACLRLDHEAMTRAVTTHPEYLRSPKAIFKATMQDRADVVAALLDLGVSTEVEDDSHQRPLHVAAFNDALRVATLLIERGAQIDAVVPAWDSTPIGYAIYREHSRLVDVLSRHSRDVGNLVFVGALARLRELTASDASGVAAQILDTDVLCWLPDDEQKAVEIVDLLLANGADVKRRSSAGLTAEDIARRRGLNAAAERLARASSS